MNCLLQTWITASVLCLAALCSPAISSAQTPHQSAQVYHILLSQEDAAHTLADTLRSLPPAQQLAAFQAQAKQQSQDTDSAPQGGYLGVLTEQDYDVTFMKQVFEQPEATVSAPVKTDYGWHIFYVLQKQTQTVGQLCDERLHQDIANASPLQRKILQLSDSTQALADIQEAIHTHLGRAWQRDGDYSEEGALHFYKRMPVSSALHRKGYRGILVHGERSLERAYAMDTHSRQRPVLCLRAHQYAIIYDCKGKKSALKRWTEYQYRGAVGKVAARSSVYGDQALVFRDLSEYALLSPEYQLACVATR